jgi:geranylgeranylglycerol-phosphate geranylgeranyltransferase
MNKMAYIRIIRPSGCLMVSLITVIGQALASGEVPKLISLAPAFLTGFFMTASSFTINDYVDHEIDAINAPWRPIPSGMMARDEALRFGVALGSIGSAISLFTSPPACFVAIGSLLLSILYTVKGKYIGLLGHAMVALSIASTFIFGALTIMESITPLVSGIFTVSFLYILGGELTQSISDYEGDEAKGVRSMAILKGRKAAAVTATVCYMLTALAGAVTSSLHGAGLESYTFIIILGTFTTVSYITLPLLRNPDKETAMVIRRRINYLAYLIITGLLFASLLASR